MKNIKSLGIIYLILLLFASKTIAQNPNTYPRIERNHRLPKGFEYRNLKLPFSNEWYEYIVQKVPIDNERGRFYFLLNGDIIVGDNRVRSATLGRAFAQLWEGDIPIYVDESVRVWDMCKTLNEAIKVFHTKTKIRFVEYSGQRDYIKIRIGNAGEGVGGYSHLGRIGGRQEIVIAKGQPSAVFIHEIMHALGILHEQSRADRDQYIKFNVSNLKDSKYAHNFQKNIFTSTSSKYDYNSIMHYSGNAFAKDSTLTLECKNGSPIPCPKFFGNSTLSIADIIGIDELYKNVNFSNLAMPIVNLLGSGSDSGFVNAQWDIKEVQMRKTIVVGNRIHNIKIHEAFTLVVKAPQQSRNFRDICNGNLEAVNFLNYDTISPLLKYFSNEITETVGRFPNEYTKTTGYGSIIIKQLPISYEHLEVNLDLVSNKWIPGTDATNPFGNNGEFIVWLEPSSFFKEGASFLVHGKWFDKRDFKNGINYILKSINNSWRKKIQSDGPMNEPGGFGQNNPQ